MRNVEYKSITPNFISNLEKLIFKNKIKKYELAKEIGVSAGTITQYLNGAIKNIGIDQLKKICKYFSITENDLLNNNIDVIQTLKEESVKYDVSTKYYEDSPLNITLYIHFAKVIDSVFEEKEFENIFYLTKEQFMNKVANLELSLNFLSYLRNEKNIDMNELFEEKRFDEVFTLGNIFQDRWKDKSK